MVPNTFEGVTIKGTFDPIGYDVGYLSAIKLRQENSFHNMAEAAGVGGDINRGLVLTRLSSEPRPGLSLYAANYLVPDVFNTAYGYAEYTHDLTSDLSVKTGLQYTDQRSVGSALRGAKPGDIPVEQPTKVDLSINLKTAKALGLMIPQSVLVRAGEIIQ